MKDTKSELSFNTFCGLHYTSDSDVNKFSDNLDSFKNKSFILNTYVNYFTNICCSMFKIKGLPKEIDEQFVIRTLINRGSIAFFKTTINKRIRDNRTGEYKDEKIAYPLMAQPFRTNKRFNSYGKPTSITLYVEPNCSSEFDNITLDNPDEFEIVKLNPMATSLYPTIWYFCNKIVEVQRAIDVNVYNNQTPLVIECTKEQEKTATELIKKWANQVKHLILNKSSGARAEDLFRSQDISAQWKADKMTEVMQYYKSEFFTMLGVNHIPYEKKANMLKDEVGSNSHILALTIDSMLDTLNECAKLVNEKFDTEIHFEYTIDDIVRTSRISKAESKETAGVITEDERKKEEIEEAVFKEKIESGDLDE